MIMNKQILMLSQPFTFSSGRTNIKIDNAMKQRYAIFSKWTEAVQRISLEWIPSAKKQKTKRGSGRPLGWPVKNCRRRNKLAGKTWSEFNLFVQDRDGWRRFVGVLSSSGTKKGWGRHWSNGVHTSSSRLGISSHRKLGRLSWKKKSALIRIS